MDACVCRYQFDKSLDITDVEATVTLAVLATESLHGEPRVRLEARHSFDANSRSCTIDATNEAGVDLNRLFLGFMSREFGRDSFQVEMLGADSSPLTPAA